MDSSWKRIIYLICTIQVGGGITIIGVVSFIPLFLAELGLHDQGQAAMWAGIVSGVTPLMVALSAPYWSRKANQWGPRKVMMLILFILMITVGALCFYTDANAIIDSAYFARYCGWLCAHRISHYCSYNT